MVLSRRLFLIGSSAAIAAAKLPAFAEERIAVTPLPAMATFKHRRICDLTAGFWDTEGQPDTYSFVSTFAATPTQFELFVRGRPFFNVMLGDGATLRWVATPGNEVILLPGETVALSVKPERLQGAVKIIVADKVDEGPPIMRIELHQYPFDKPLLQDLDEDNSLEARLERVRQAKEWAALHPDGVAWDDDEDAV
jgi:hypothetical protein